MKDSVQRELQDGSPLRTRGEGTEEEGTTTGLMAPSWSSGAYARMMGHHEKPHLPREGREHEAAQRWDEEKTAGRRRTR